MSFKHDENLDVHKSGQSDSEGNQERGNGRNVNKEIAFRTLSQITAITKQILGPEYDYESVAAEIWFTSWEDCGCPKEQTEVQVSYNFVRQRCFDHAKHEAVVKKANKVRVSSMNRELLEQPDLNSLITKCDFRPRQFEIFCRFYLQGQTLKEISDATSLPIKQVRSSKDQILEELKRVSRQENL